MSTTTIQKISFVLMFNEYVKLSTISITMHILKKVLNAIDAVLHSSIPLRTKLNCVVMRGLNEDEITDFVEWTKVG